MLKKKNIFVSILLSFVTCGIYQYFWIASISNDISDYTKQERNGWMEAFLCYITFGIYWIYWNYKQGRRIADAQEIAGIRASDNSVLFLVISFFGLIAVPSWVIQINLNEIIDRAN